MEARPEGFLDFARNDGERNGRRDPLVNHQVTTTEVASVRGRDTRMISQQPLPTTGRNHLPSELLAR